MMMMVPTLAAFSADSALDNLSRIAVFLLMLSVLVVLARIRALHRRAAAIGVRVNDFAVGFGPTLLKWTSPRSGTNYRLNLFPLGGYCAMQGEDGKTQRGRAAAPSTSSSIPAIATDFQSKTPWRRLAIVAAGPIANFIVALVILIVGRDRVRRRVRSRQHVDRTAARRTRRACAPGCTSATGSSSIDGVAVRDGQDMVDAIHASPGKPITLVYLRHGVSQTVTVTPMRRVVDGQGRRASSVSRRSSSTSASGPARRSSAAGSSSPTASSRISPASAT